MFPIIRGFVRQRVDQSFDQNWKAVLIDRADEAEAPEPLPEVTRPEYRVR
jgi:hypothetical protein